MDVISSVTGNEKGFVLIESILALTILFFGLSIYSPTSMQILDQMRTKKDQTEMLRVMQDQARILKDKKITTKTFKSGKDTFILSYSEQGQKKRIRVKSKNEAMDVWLLEVPEAKEPLQAE